MSEVENPPASDVVEEYEDLLRESYRLDGHSTSHGVGKVAPLKERKEHAQKVKQARNRILTALRTDPQPASDVVEVLEALLPELGTLPLSEDWMYSAIRHCQRNIDFDIDDGGNEPSRYAGTALAKLANLLPAILTALRTDRAAVVEECARVAESAANEWKSAGIAAGLVDKNTAIGASVEAGHTIAQAIRALLNTEQET